MKIDGEKYFMPTRRGSVIKALADSAHPPMPIAMHVPKLPFYRRLRTKLLLLICLCVILTESLVFIPSLANRQHRWFENQHRFAYALSLSVHRTDEYGLEERSLTNLELVELSIMAPDGSIKNIITEQPNIKIDKIVNLDKSNDLNFIFSAIKTLFIGGNRIIQVSGQIGSDGTILSLLTRDHSLREALFQFSERFFFSSLTIALIVAVVIYLLVTEILLRPVYKIYTNVLNFVVAQDDPKAILVPEKRCDEIGLVQQRIATIETELQRGYAQQKHLAELGLAVSKINHDMRNILASAQLISDRIATIDDPLIKRLAPRLLRTINRAIHYTHNVLTYGRIQEHAPHYQKLHLKPLIDEVIDMLEPDQYKNIAIENLVGDEFEIEADGEQLHRVLTNLCRNGAQALSSQPQSQAGHYPPKTITLAAHYDSAEAVISVRDTGPGLPEQTRAHLFEPFRGAGHNNGTGLGLAICHELIRAHGGTIRLIDSPVGGTHFEIRLPHPRQSQAGFST